MGGYVEAIPRLGLSPSAARSSSPKSRQTAGGTGLLSEAARLRNYRFRAEHPEKPTTIARDTHHVSYQRGDRDALRREVLHKPLFHLWVARDKPEDEHK